MSTLSRELLTEDAIHKALDGLSGWTVVGDALTKRFEFGAYASGLAFAVAVGHLADSMDHHPDLLIGYRKVSVTTSTHDAGGLTQLDLELARRIESIA